MEISFSTGTPQPSAMPITPLLSHPLPQQRSAYSSSPPSVPSPVPFSLPSTRPLFPTSSSSRRAPLPRVPLFDRDAAGGGRNRRFAAPASSAKEVHEADAAAAEGSERKDGGLSKAGTWRIVIDPPNERRHSVRSASASPTEQPAERKESSPPPPSASSVPASTAADVAQRKRKRDSSEMVDVGEMDIDEPLSAEAPLPPATTDEDPLLYPHSLKKLRLQEEDARTSSQPSPPGPRASEAGGREEAKKRDSLSSRLRSLVMDPYSALFASGGTAQDHIGDQLTRMKLGQDAAGSPVHEREPPEPSKAPPQHPSPRQNAPLPKESPPSVLPGMPRSSSPAPGLSSSSRLHAIKEGKVAKQMERLRKRKEEKAKQTAERETDKHLHQHLRQHRGRPTRPLRRDSDTAERRRSLRQAQEEEKGKEDERAEPTAAATAEERSAGDDAAGRKGVKDDAWSADVGEKLREERARKGVERRKVDRNHSILEKREQQRRKEQEQRERREKEESEAREREQLKQREAADAERREAEAREASERQQQQREQGRLHQQILDQQAKALQAERERQQREADKKRDAERAKPRPRAIDDDEHRRRSSRLSSLHSARKPPSDDESLHTRLQARRLEQMERESREELERAERERLQPLVERQVRFRARGKDYVGLVREFAPALVEGKGRVAGAEVRKVLRRCLAQFHPDKQVLKPLKERIECEEIFAHVKKAYEELAE